MAPRATAAEKGKGAAKAGGRKRAAAEGDELPLSALLARCTRADLEALLQQHEDDLPDLRAAVEAKLRPEQRKKSRAEQAPVAGDASLVSTGPFSALDAEVTLHIFLSLADFKDRLRCVSEVCKGWRSLRRHPALWSSLSLSAPAFSAAGLMAFVMGPRSPLPSPACVRTLALRGEKTFDAKSFKAVLKALSSASSVTLSGKKLSKDAVSVLAKPREAPLQTLSLGKMKDAEAAVLDLLAASPALTDLQFDGQVTDSWVDVAGARAAAARGGGVPLLSRLGVGERWGGWNVGLHVSALGRLGAAFPELAQLRIHALRSLESRQLGEWAHGAPPPRSAWVPLPALRTLHISSLGDSLFVKLLPDAQVQAFLAHVAAAAPGLRVLHLSRGDQYLSQNDLKAGATYSPLPALSGRADLCGIGTLQQLETLAFEKIAITAADVAAADLPQLKRLTLTDCGPHAAAAASAIAAAAPRLQSLAVAGLTCAALDGTAGPGAAGFATLASASLTELRISTGGVPHGAPKATESNEAVGHALRDLAAAGALPALRALEVATLPALMPADTFQAAHPWTKLERLALSGCAPECVPAVLATLRAPALKQLSLPGITRGVATQASAALPAWQAVVTHPAVCAAYEKLRTDKHGAPLLPPLRYAAAADAKPPPLTEEAEDEGAPGGAESD